jgi:hypothetical protein
MSTIIIPDYILIILIGVSLFIGIGIGFILKKKRSPYSNNNPFSVKINRQIYRFKKYNWAIIGIFWFFLLVIIFPTYSTNSIIDFAINLISLGIGLNISYNLMKIIMRKPVRTGYDIWVIRIKSIIFACSGIFIAIFAASTTYIIDKSGFTPMVGPSQLTIFLWSIGLGMIIFAAYMEFVFERRAGILVFTGKQKF